jgi:hypothetical protein
MISKGLKFDAAASTQVDLTPLTTEVAPIEQPATIEKPADIVIPTDAAMEQVVDDFKLGDESPLVKKSLDYSKFKEFGILEDEDLVDIDDEKFIGKISDKFKKLNEREELARVALEADVNLKNDKTYQYFDYIANNKNNLELYKAKKMNVDKYTEQEIDAEIAELEELDDFSKEREMKKIEREANSYKRAASEYTNTLRDNAIKQKQEAQKTLLSSSSKINVEAADILAKSDTIGGITINKEARSRYVDKPIKALQSGEFDKDVLSNPKLKNEVAFMYYNQETLKKYWMEMGKKSINSTLRTTPTVQVEGALQTSKKEWKDMSVAERRISQGLSPEVPQ